ncbi:HAD family hydrolase [Marinibacterium profundimaris]|uniref:phosphoglycolate phosphatase n=1 Tax=Marinibacterium profundimaris TaxID=1679460 RepID=A0A225NCK4_9RHOB|nr:HAD family hydrolase [Marinibacterium profundimaris]OWU69023.1 phosphatase [Marinibacterium profundimaris]
MTGPAQIEAVLFDKDGTLYDFGKSWNGWSGMILEHLSGGDEVRAEALAGAIGYDRQAGCYLPHSPAIAGTNAEVAAALAGELPGADLAAIERFLEESAARIELHEAVPLAAVLGDLAQVGLRLGVMTNDHESAARAHLSRTGVLEIFEFIAGADSGFGAKPDPDPLLAFCTAVRVRPEATVMVGDSTHDLVAGRAAGMITIGVLTGMSGPSDLAPHADAVLPDISHLATWIASR